MHFEPTQKNISDFFYNEHKIPFHQRSYIWSKEVLTEFWEDIYYVHENRNEKYMHFLGSIITTKGFNSNNIIDGQQRITTLVLFVLATVKILWDELEENTPQHRNPGVSGEEWQEFQTKLRSHKDEVIRELEFMFRHDSIEGVYSLKLTPSNKDQQGFNKVLKDISPVLRDKIKKFGLNSSESSQKEISRVFHAYEEIKKIIHKNFYPKGAISSSHVQGQLINFLKDIKENVRFVDVSISDGDPTSIFNNLNTKGVPLSTLDITKNYVFQDVEENDEVRFNDVWMDFEKNLLRPIQKKYFQSIDETKEVNEERFLREQSKHIKGYWFPLATVFSSTVSQKNVNSEIQAYLNDNTQDENLDIFEKAERKVKILSKYVSLYNLLTYGFYDESLKNSLPDDLKIVLYDFFRMDCPNTVFNFIYQSVDYFLSLDDSENSRNTQDDIIDSLKLVQNRIMRDSFKRSSNQAPKDIYFPLFKYIKNNDYNFKLTRQFLQTKSYPFIGDDEIKQIFMSNRVYGVQRLKFFLEEFEIKERRMTNTQRRNFLDGEYKHGDNGQFEVDHLMPQKIENWKEYLEDKGFTYNKEEDYFDVIHRIGNCFLLEKGLNQRKSNRSFADSQEIINGNTSYAEFIKAQTSWTEEEINQRSKRYYDFFISMYAEPKEYEVRNDNNKKNQEETAKNYIERVSPVFDEYNIKYFHMFVGFNKFARNDFSLTKEFREFLESNEIRIAQTKETAIQLNFLTNSSTQQRRMNVWNGRKNNDSRADEYLFSIQNHKNLMNPTDVLAFFFNDGEMFCINCAEISINQLRKRLNAI